MASLASMNVKSYSCWNTVGPSRRISPSRKVFEILGHCAVTTPAGKRGWFYEPDPLSAIKLPFVVANIGEMPPTNSSSIREASSRIIKFAPE